LLYHTVTVSSESNTIILVPPTYLIFQAEDKISPPPPSKLKFLTSSSWSVREGRWRSKGKFDLSQPRETIFTSAARWCASVDRLLCDICFALVLTKKRKREREREFATMRAVAVYSTLFSESYPRGIPFPTRGTCVARFHQAHHQVIHMYTYNRTLHRRISLNKSRIRDCMNERDIVSTPEDSPMANKCKMYRSAMYES